MKATKDTTNTKTLAWGHEMACVRDVVAPYGFSPCLRASVAGFSRQRSRSAASTAFISVTRPRWNAGLLITPLMNAESL